jgi:hypothetical protein
MRFATTTCVHHRGIHRFMAPVEVRAMATNHLLPICRLLELALLGKMIQRVSEKNANAV